MGALGTAVLGGLPLLSSCATDPVTGRSQFTTMSAQDEITLDHKQSPYQFSADYGIVQDVQLNAYINRVGKELSARSHRPQMPFSFRGVNAAYINAYAFPGGSIAATRGILVELNNEAELAGLLGHEIGHVCARHAAEQAGKGTLAQLLLAGASIATTAAGYGGAADLVQGLGSIGAGALLAHYSRDNEREADALGMEYMTRAGYTPLGMVGLMKILQQNGRNRPGAIELMFATHPMSEERLRNAEQAADERYQQLLSGPVHSERYMDHTAGLRRIKGAITALQQGSSALGKKNYQDAKAAYLQALKITPNDYAALVMMAKLCLKMQQPAKALRYAEKAVQVYPIEAQAHLVAGSASINLKNYGRALQQLVDYDRLLPGNPEVVFFKGYSLEKMQRTREAAEQYSSYLRRVRSGKQAQYAYSRLKQWGYVR
jgi:predicted Zn-dependent protease